MPWYNDLRPVSDDNRLSYSLTFPELVNVDAPTVEKAEPKKKKNAGGGMAGERRWWFGLGAVFLCAVLAARVIKRP